MSDESIIANIINPSAAIIQRLPFPEATQNNIIVDVLRLDLIHPVISGNKFFKLKYPVLKAIKEGYKGVLSYGGAYSNHLIALAAMCKETGLASIGIVRGELNTELSPTLKEAQSYGMKLIFMNREQYKISKSGGFTGYNPYLVLPEGGSSADGVRGASGITELGDWSSYNQIVCAVGTGTMFAGILSTIDRNQKLLGISALKMPMENDVEDFIRRSVPGRDFEIDYNYHFGGFAKKTPELISFMNDLWHQYHLPTDFVYNAKLFFAIRALISAGKFEPDSRILAIHSGGLQGNRSITELIEF